MGGNIIDLCPVGALTSKPYSFKGRSWELINYKTIDVLDSINSDIIVSFKGSEILRVLPCFTSHNISEWISDKTRFFYDSFSPWIFDCTSTFRLWSIADA